MPQLLSEAARTARRSAGASVRRFVLDRRTARCISAGHFLSRSPADVYRSGAQSIVLATAGHQEESRNEGVGDSREN